MSRREHKEHLNLSIELFFLFLISSYSLPLCVTSKIIEPRLFTGSCQTVAHGRASRVVNSFSKMRTTFYSLAFAAALALAAPVGAQLAQKNSTIEADRIERTPTGGNAKGLVIRDPQLDFDADSASYDGNDLRNFKTVTELRARGNVKVRLAPKPKTSAEKPFQIQSKSDEATLTFATRTLILKGNLSGFYRVANGPQTLLSGETAKFNYAPQGVKRAYRRHARKNRSNCCCPPKTGKNRRIGADRGALRFAAH